MVGTILPIVHGERQQGKPLVSLWLHTIGYVVGGTMMGATLGAVGALLPWPVLPISRGFTILLVTGLLSLLYSMHELGLIHVPAPQCRWQVPQHWRYSLPTRITSLLYGLGLGFGLATRIPVRTFYVVATWAVLVGNPLLGALCMGVFGLGRALPLLFIARALRGDEESFQTNQILRNWEPAMHLINALALGSVGSCLIAAGMVLYI